MKDVRGVAGTRSDGRKDGQNRFSWCSYFPILVTPDCKFDLMVSAA